MIKKGLLFIIILVLALLFILKGIPYLKELKNEPLQKDSTSSQKGNQTITGGRSVTVDISVESICYNMITDEIYERCSNRTNCESTCESEGCDYFGLTFVGSSFTGGKCRCNCLEENKIKKALNPT